MEKWIFLFIGMLALALLVSAEASYRKTISDMYMESYAAAMRRQTGMTAAEVRVEEYRSRYEICDEHHNCTNATAQSREQAKAESRPENVQPFLHVPIWQ